MAIKPRISKDIYGAALSGDGYSSITKRKSDTNGTYANGIEALAQINGNGLSGANAQAPLLKAPDVSSLYNGNIVKPIYNSRIELGGGATGGTTREGVITGGLGVTKMPTINPIKSMGITKTASTQAKYGDILAAMKQSSVKNIAVNSASAPQQTQAAAPAPTETAAKTESAAETPATYEEYLEQQRELLDQRKAEADRQAEAAKERAAVDAQASYAQNMATYGTNAENMAQMGLQGGGYGDYVNAQAYAQKRADMQQANVTEQAAKAQNNATYEDALSELNKSDIEHREKEKETETQKKDSIYASLWEKAIDPNSNLTAENIAAMGKEYGLDDAKIAELQNIVATSRKDKNSNMYGSLLELANSGSMSAEQIAKIATDKGLDAEQIKGLTDAANKYKENVYKTNYSGFMGSIEDGNMTKNILDTALKNDTITQAQYDDLLNKFQTSYYDTYAEEIATNFAAVNTDTVDKSLQRGEITQAQYDDIKKKYNESVASAITSATLFYDSGIKLDENNAKALAEKIKNSGWLSDENKDKIDTFLADDYKKEDDGGCFAKGTLITVADGSQVPVENLNEGDNVLVFNHITGNIDVAPISYIFRDGQKDYEVLTLRFDDNTSIDVLFEHGFFDTDCKRYVLINATNAKEYIGHRFYRVDFVDGAYKKKVVTLADYTVHTEQTECYSVLTAAHINHIANGMLAVTDDIKGIYNIFDLDDNYKYDAEKMAADIEQYGLFTYDDWREYATEEQFEAFNGAYLKVAIGKGLVTIDEIVGYINRFLRQ